eukprot:TRINITY_DN103697_c0_g1_i1.p1 TRINITY_DN103697_c0_g1~~TRINITY_DN103697_c0_g1_i1.p1  ORF type:complete len:494 (-),score=31.63 TRINITY_DN103697_c0_g1_i1:72-1532(-)
MEVEGDLNEKVLRVEEMVADMQAKMELIKQIICDIKLSASMCMPKIAPPPTKQVVLNVGGEKFYTSTETLTADKSSFFCALLQQWPDPPNKSNSDEYFIDRDPHYVNQILNYLREGKLDGCLSGFSVKTVADEHLLRSQAVYFQINSLVDAIDAAIAAASHPKRDENHEVATSDQSDHGHPSHLSPAGGPVHRRRNGNHQPPVASNNTQHQYSHTKEPSSPQTPRIAHTKSQSPKQARSTHKRKLQMKKEPPPQPSSDTSASSASPPLSTSSEESESSWSETERPRRKKGSRKSKTKAKHGRDTTAAPTTTTMTTTLSLSTPHQTQHLQQDPSSASSSSASESVASTESSSTQSPKPKKRKWTPNKFPQRQVQFHKMTCKQCKNQFEDRTTLHKVPSKEMGKTKLHVSPMCKSCISSLVSARVDHWRKIVPVRKPPTDSNGPQCIWCSENDAGMFYNKVRSECKICYLAWVALKKWNTARPPLPDR